MPEAPTKIQREVIVVAVVAIVAVALVSILSPQDSVPVITLILGFAALYLKQNEAVQKSLETHMLINSRMDELLKSEKARSRAEGMAAQKEEDRT